MSDFLRFVSHQIEDFAMQVTFNPVQGTGTVVYNLSLVRAEDLEQTVSVFRATCEAGVSPSSLIRTLNAGEELDGFVIPQNFCGILKSVDSTSSCKSNFIIMYVIILALVAGCIIIYVMSRSNPKQNISQAKTYGVISSFSS